jgi:hypothetical protein
MMLAPCTGNTAIVSRATDTGTEAPKRPVHYAGTGEWSKTQRIRRFPQADVTIAARSRNASTRRLSHGWVRTLVGVIAVRDGQRFGEP